jgi:16S rRNA G966 N2-methylase RsmD
VLTQGNCQALDLSFRDVRERLRTKHVHRLHPYLGKFIPQLVEHFLRRYFRPGDWLLDPFAGSGTALVEAHVLGINAVGVELSAWNALIARVKLAHYDLALLEAEVRDALARLDAFVRQGRRWPGGAEPPSGPYLRTWLAPDARAEVLFFRELIPRYQHQDVLRVILSRATRSARQVAHYDLARPQRVVREPYYCLKHRRICQPITSAVKFLRRYALDTVRRLREFAALRTAAQATVLCADARAVSYDGWLFDGVFTSPPYVGLIDYHEQHRYAYELFPDQADQAALEIGSPRHGQGRAARAAYVRDVATALRRIPLRAGAPVFIVANDAHGLYPQIARQAGLELVTVLHRPVLMRTERDNAQYSEAVFHLVKGN